LQSGPVTDWADVLTHGVSTLTEALLAASFAPFWRTPADLETSRPLGDLMLSRRTPAHRLRHWDIGKMFAELHCGNLLIGLMISGIAVVAIFGSMASCRSSTSSDSTERRHSSPI